MILRKITFFTILLFTILSYSQENNREIYSVEVFKIAQKNEKIIAIARLDVNKKGVVKRLGGKKEKINMKTFTESINKLIEARDNVVKVDGDNDQRTGFQEAYNNQAIFITVIYQDDYNKESFVNNTCYRYQERNLPIDQSEYSFYKYFSDSDLEIIKRLLR